MIKKLKIRNFKSLRNVDVELGNFTVLIGPNNSGKSNLMDSLLFLHESTKETLQKTINRRGGFEHIAFGGEGDDFEMSIEFSLNKELFKYLLSVNRKREVEEEKLVIEDRNVISRSNQSGKALSGDGALVDFMPHREETSVYNASRSENYPLVKKSYDYFNSWRLYQIVTSNIRSILPTKKSFDLEKSGANLAQVLHTLHNARPRLFSKVEEILKQGIPEIDELLTPPTEDGQTYLALREKGFEREFDYYQLSDGTLKLLAYITAITLPEPRLICFEEPENFIHHELLELMVQLLRHSEKQVILATHSPYFLDVVEPEDIRFVKKEKGETKISKIKNPKRLKEALKEMGLGELWYSGEIGGIR